MAGVPLLSITTYSGVEGEGRKKEMEKDMQEGGCG